MIRSVLLTFATLLVSATAQAGTWGIGSFENDDAADWVVECTQSKSMAPVAQALAAVLQADFVEAPDAAMAIAAAETVAAALGKPSKQLPDELRAWIDRQPRAKLAELAPNAKKALARILDPEGSELPQLWSESDNKKWTATVAELMARLGGA
jgi:hypothetical protein